MSEEPISGLTVIEKIIGIIILITGIILSYYTYTNMKAAQLAANLFITVGFALIILGAFLIIVKTK